jgi:hypothetical protein
MVAGIDVSFAVRLASNHEFLRIVALHHIDALEPEVGIWIKEATHGYGFGREAIAAEYVRGVADRTPAAQNITSRLTGAARSRPGAPRDAGICA